MVKKKNLRVTENDLPEPPKRGTRIIILAKVFPKGRSVWTTTNAFST